MDLYTFIVALTDLIFYTVREIYKKGTIMVNSTTPTGAQVNAVVPTKINLQCATQLVSAYIANNAVEKDEACRLRITWLNEQQRMGFFIEGF